MAAPSNLPKLQPLEELVIAGLLQRFKEHFNCPVHIITSNEEDVVAQLANEGKELTYPYAFIKQDSVGQSDQSYHSSIMSRKGIISFVEDNNLVSHKVRILPVKQSFTVRYKTNSAFGAGSSLWFTKQWLFARVNGALQFNIKFGMLLLSINVSLSEDVPVPVRENVTDSESCYIVENSLVVNGYMSSDSLGTEGIINDIAVTHALEYMAEQGWQLKPF